MKTVIEGHIARVNDALSSLQSQNLAVETFLPDKLLTVHKYKFKSQ